eukprot:1394761-Amorphochlora_amoeboformis.AAC.1
MNTTSMPICDIPHGGDFHCRFSAWGIAYWGANRGYHGDPSGISIRRALTRRPEMLRAPCARNYCPVHYPTDDCRHYERQTCNPCPPGGKHERWSRIDSSEPK